MSRPSLAFIAWTSTPGRAVDIATALGGEARPFNALGLVDKRAIPLRYLLDAVRTLGYLVRRRPRAVIATHPPLFPGLIAYAYARVARAPFVLDSHISAFGLMNDRLSELMLPLHRWLAPRASAVLVTDEELGGIARSWGARPAIVHEPPLAWPVAPAKPLRERPLVLFAGTFQRDEPVAEVMEAARALPELDVHMTGDLRRCPAELRAGAPPNVKLVGFLPGREFARALEEADVVLSLSTERVSVMRTAYEAVYAGRPLVVPDRPLLRSIFPYAVYAEVTPEGVAAGLREAVERHSELLAAAGTARELQQERWRAQLAELRGLVSPGAPRGPDVHGSG